MEFKRGKCREKGDHEGIFNNRRVVKMHICKLCFRNSGVMERHTEQECSEKA